MGTTDYGTQTIVWDYKYPAKGADFSVSLKHTFKPGVYYGGLVTPDGSGDAVVSPMCVILEDYVSSTIAVKVSTSASFTVGVSSGTTGYLYVYYTFAESPSNYMDVGVATDLSTVTARKGVILANVSKSGSTLTVTYTNKTWGTYDHTYEYYKRITTDQQIRSDLAIGTSPFSITSTDVNTNLNADMVDGRHVQTTLTDDTNYIPTSAAVKAYVFPVGSFYTQYPNAESSTELTAFPLAYRPATLFGGLWEEQFKTGVFFRTEGGTYESERASNGLQSQALLAHLHAVTYWYGAFHARGGWGDYQYLGAEPAPVGTFNTRNTGGSETRPNNRLFKIWKRTA
jgi:hypothetical protein